MGKMNKNQLGLKVGIFFAFLHAVWAIFVVAMPTILQNFLNWIFKIHFLNPIWIITKFNLIDAIWLIIVTFIVGYIIGWVFAYIHNLMEKR